MKNDPCWKNYKMIGTKTKGSKTVPNCVKKESMSFANWLVLHEAKKTNKDYNQ